jgi:hypothetical protein
MTSEKNIFEHYDYFYVDHAGFVNLTTARL